MVLLWIMVLLQSFDVRHTKKIGYPGLSCELKQVASLTKQQMEITLTLFDEANGKNLGKWPPGFPALTVDKSSTVIVDKVLCSLLFLTHGLEKILEDQRNNVNHEDVSLHRALKESITRVELLAVCLRSIRGSNCSSPFAPPEMPETTFERKQWSHTLLTAATHFLQWLQHRLHSLRQKKSWTTKNQQNAVRPKHHAFVKGSVYLL